MIRENIQMKYCAQLLNNGTVGKQTSFRDITHPNQVIAHFINVCPNDMNLIAVMNEKGDRWLYIVKKKGPLYKPKLLRVDHAQHNSYDVDLIMSGNKPIFRSDEI